MHVCIWQKIPEETTCSVCYLTQIFSTHLKVEGPVHSDEYKFALYISVTNRYADTLIKYIMRF